MRFEGMTAIVTGGAGGIGSATVNRLCEEGATVAVADLDGDRAEQVARNVADPDRAFPVQVDITDLGSIGSMVGSVLERTDRIDVLVNNAGIDRVGPFVDTEPPLWDRLLSVNLRGPIAVTHRILPHMIEAGGGCIVFVASDAGRVGSSGEVVYSAAKGGTIAFAKALAREVARGGIRCNAVAPGPTDTDLLDEFEGDLRRILDGIVRATPLRRLAEPHEIAAAVAYLASDDASFVTGQTLSVSGGLTMI